MKATLFESETGAVEADRTSAAIDISDVREFGVMFRNTGTGTCTITFQHRVDTTVNKVDAWWQTIPTSDGTSTQVYEDVAINEEYEAQIGNVGADFFRAVISDIVGDIAIDMVAKGIEER